MEVENCKTGSKRLEAVKRFVALLYVRRGELNKVLEKTEMVQGADKEIQTIDTQIQNGEMKSKVLDAEGAEKEVIKFNIQMFKKKWFKP